MQTIPLKKATYFSITAVIVLGIVSLFSCSKEASVTEKTEEIAVMQSAAQVYHRQEWWPFDRALWVPCANNNAGEYVKLDGKIHFNDQVTINNNRFTFTSHANPGAVSGTGLETGDRYRASGGGHQIMTGSFTNGQFSGFIIDRMRITGEGPDNNALVQLKAHITISANGRVSREIAEIVVNCQ